jgi:hypothetical protein
LIRDNSSTPPERQKAFDERYANFRHRLGARWWDALAKKYDVEVAVLFELES